MSDPIVRLKRTVAMIVLGGGALLFLPLMCVKKRGPTASARAFVDGRAAAPAVAAGRLPSIFPEAAVNVVAMVRPEVLTFQVPADAAPPWLATLTPLSRETARASLAALPPAQSLRAVREALDDPTDDSRRLFTVNPTGSRPYCLAVGRKEPAFVVAWPCP